MSSRLIEWHITNLGRRLGAYSAHQGVMVNNLRLLRGAPRFEPFPRPAEAPVPAPATAPVAGPAGPPDPLPVVKAESTVSSLADDISLPEMEPPPASRFMLRVAPTTEPHRPTKRNYDYFTELDAALSEQDSGGEDSGGEDPVSEDVGDEAGAHDAGESDASESKSAKGDMIEGND